LFPAAAQSTKQRHLDLSNSKIGVRELSGCVVARALGIQDKEIAVSTKPETGFRPSDCYVRLG
jgi:hypothetical protein